MTGRSFLWVAGALVLASGTAWAQIPTIHTLDTGGVGYYTSVAFGADGLPLVSYYDVVNGDLKVAHCLDVACAASTKQTLDSTGDVGRYTSIAVGADGRGIVSYVDATNGMLKAAHCNDVACTGATTAPLASLAMEDRSTAIAVAGGLATIAIGGAGSLRVARCVDVVCSAATVAPTGGAARNATIAVGGDGLPVIAADYLTGVRVRHCNDAACTTATTVPLSEPGPGDGTTTFDEYDPALARAPDGRVVVAFSQTATMIPLPPRNSVVFRRCADAACTSLTPSGSILVGMYTIKPDNPSLGILPNDRPLAAWARLDGSMPDQLQIGLCGDPACTGAFVPIVDGPGTGTHLSMAVSPAGDTLMAYHDQSTGSVKTGYFAAPAVGADLAVLVTDAPDPVAPTQGLHYMISGQNLGPDQATGVTASLTLPVGVSFLSASFGCQYDAAAHTVNCPGPSVIPPASVVQVALVDVMVPPALPGPLDGTASIAATSSDPASANNTASVSTATRLGLRIAPAAPIEGQSGLRDARIDLTVIDDGHGVPAPLTVSYGTAAGTATANTDYVETAGALTFASASTQTVAVSVIGDLLPEPNETFYLLPAVPPAMIVVDNPASTIVDDDLTVSAQVELGHGASVLGDLSSAGGPVPPEDLYRVVVPGRASFEAVVDGLSGDLLPLSLQRLNLTGTAVLQTAVAEGTGASVSLRWQNTSVVSVANQLIRVRSGGCTTGCGPDDVYRLRSYETTARVPRFNNTATQVTVLVIQNPSDQEVSGRIDYWNAAGQLIANGPLTIAPHGISVTSTTDFVPAQSGSITVSHDRPYGVLQGKAVALEPATGFSFDSPLEYRPR